MNDQPPQIICVVVKVHDGDGPYWCGNGVKIRVAGVQSPDFTSAEPCRRDKPGYVCDDVKAAASQRIASRLVLGRTLSCQPVGRSWKRIVATCRFSDGRNLRCTLNATGASVDWLEYVRRYNLARCPR